MYCSNCGKEIQNDVEFCNYCGNRIKSKMDLIKNSKLSVIQKEKALEFIDKVTFEDMKTIINDVENTKKNKKKFLLIIIIVIIIAILTIIIITNNTKSKSKIVNKNIFQENTVKSKTWQEDAKDTTIYVAMCSLEPDSSKDIEYVVNSLKKVEQENLFAKLFIEKYEAINYTELDEVSKDFLNGYLKELFDEDNKTAYNNKCSKIIEVWKGNYNGEVPNYKKSIYIKFEDYPTSIYFNNDFEYDYVVITKDNNGYEVNVESYLNSISVNPTMNLVKQDGSYICEPLNIDELNNIINSYAELIDVIIDYRDQVYKPEIEQINLRIEAKEKIKKEQQSKKPAIGMTEAEVRNSKWGDPDKINKDTYSWGITQQWVYDDYGYIYFTNGIVTSISER